jgi:hypothetical protein
MEGTMNKIPVGETISGAYGFAFAGFLSVLGTVWLPYLAFLAFSAGVIFLIAPDLPGHIMHGEFDVPTFYSIWRVAGLIWLASLVARAMVTVGLQQRALGLTQGPTFFFFSLGARVWLMLATEFLAILAIVLIAILTSIVAGIGIWASIHYIPQFGKAVAVILGIVAACWFIYACVRLVFFLPAVVVAEETIGLARSWELGGGNFWRIVAVVFVVFVPAAIGLGIVRNAVMGPFMPMTLQSHLFHAGMTPGEMADSYNVLVKTFLLQLRGIWPFFVVYELIQELIFLGLGNGAVGKAYRAVTGKG